MIELVLVDPADTVFETTAATRRALDAALAELWETYPDHDFSSLTTEHLFSVRAQVGRELAGRVDDLSAVRLAIWQRALEESGVEDAELAATINATFEERRHALLQPSPDAHTTLAALAARYQLVLVAAEPLPESSGLQVYFQRAVVAAEVGTALFDGSALTSALGETAASTAVLVTGASGDLHLPEGLRVVEVNPEPTSVRTGAHAVVWRLADVIPTLAAW